jgi:DNA invertase Pin-like site-specific DNA recombinase
MFSISCTNWRKGASLRVLEPAIDTGGCRMVLTVPCMVAEMELGFIRARQRAGIDAAKAKGIYKGRPRHLRPRAHRVAAQGRNGRH